MSKPHISQILLCCFLLVAPLLLFSGFRTSVKSPVEIVLQNERMPVVPKEFYIADVVDERENRSVVGWLVQASTNAEKQDSLYPVDLQGGGLSAIKQFVNHSLLKNTLLRPVIINLQKVQIVETASFKGTVEGKVQVVMSFKLRQPGDELSDLIDYNGKAVYTRSAGLAQSVEPLLRHVIENGLIYLNTWMDQQAGKNIKLAKIVKVSVADYHDNSGSEGDSVYYDVNRPLMWNDFQSQVYNSRYDAEVFPVLGYDEHTEINNGTIYLKLEIKVCLPKSACWVRDGSRNDYALNHEQRHFDIVKIIAERFKRNISQENLPVSNFDGPINVAYLEALREMNKLQRQYDHETIHGSNQSAQQAWNEKIDEELKVFGIK